MVPCTPGPGIGRPSYLANFAVFELIGRLLAIERQATLLWETDPAPICDNDDATETILIPDTLIQDDALPISQPGASSDHDSNPLNSDFIWTINSEPVPMPLKEAIFSDNTTVVTCNEHLSLITVLVKLSGPTRALIALCITLIHA